MKSALTAALSGAPPAPKEHTKTAPGFAKPKVDQRSFPCLAYAAEQEGGAQQTIPEDDGVEQLNLDRITLAGSAPTSTILQDGTILADYALHPYQRRGGRETFPTPGSSVDDRSGRYMKSGSMKSGSLSTNFISEMVFGSLPRGLTDEEKMRIVLNTPLSPSLNLLSELPTDKVGSRTAEGRKLRRHVVRGAVIVFVAAGYSGKRFIYERAKELGVRSVILDGPDSWVRLLETEGVVEKFHPIDFSDHDHVFDHCCEAIKKVKHDIGEIDGICTFCEVAVPIVARLAEKFGLPGNSPDSVDKARDKYKSREAMEHAGLPTPRHYLVEVGDDVAKAAHHVGFPCVIKPISGAASIGVIRCNNEEDLLKAFNKVQGDMKRAKIVDGALVEGGDDDGNADGNASSWIDIRLMVEEYLDGDEVDCDLIFSNGECVFGAITDNWPTMEPYFNETGSNCPSILPVSQQQELLELSVKSVVALGFKLGVFHVEAKMTSRGARLIEINARMGGGPVRQTNLLVWGVDLVEEHLLCSAGIPSRPPTARRPLMQVAEYSLNAKISGILQHADFMKQWLSDPSVLYARALVKPGEKCVCVEDGLPTWVAEILVQKPTVQEAIAFIKAIEAATEVPIEPIKH